MAETHYLALDTETTGLDWWGPHEAFLATASDAENDWHYDLSVPEDVEALVARVTRSTDLIFFNAQFDIHMLVKTGLFTYEEILAKNIHDASVLVRILVPEHEVNYKFTLKNTADAILGEGSSDEEAELKDKMFEEGITNTRTQKNLLS